MNNNVIITQDVTLYSIQILDFSTKDGDIKGYKAFYTTEAKGEYKDNFLGGKAESSFFKDDNYIKFITLLKGRSFPLKCKINFEVLSVDKPPRPVSIVL